MAGKLLAFLKVAVLLLPLLVSPQVKAREVSGTVKDKATGLPLANVKVWILQTGDSTFTNPSGFYYFPNILEGTYTFLVGRSSYQPSILTSVSVRPFLCGDANNNGSVNIQDVTYIINFLYKAGPAPTVTRAADVNHTGTINIQDVTYLINFLYKGGPTPSCP